MNHLSSARRLGLYAALALCIGCASYARLKPTPKAQIPSDDKRAAVAWGNAWRDDPQDLEEHFTPLRVDIENRSGRPLRLRYNEFALYLSSDTRLNAIPPYKIKGEVKEMADLSITLGFAYESFYIAPYYSPYFAPHITPWPGPYPFDSCYYNQNHAAWIEPLPTPDMLARAIPEGVIGSGGRVAGFLHFPLIPKG